MVHYYTYLKLHDFMDIEVFDEKFFDANKYGLKQIPIFMVSMK